MILEPTIFIIVPVFNAQQYLDRCISSLIEQTYKKIKIIIVNDGSTDDSGRICDSFKRKDERIIVIHQKNAGQSSARNNALNYIFNCCNFTSLDCLGFVDSDDFVSNDMFDNLLQLMRANDSEISCCDIYKFDNNRIDFKTEKKNIRLLNNYKGMECLLRDQIIGSHPCNKLFKITLFNDIRFPEGRLFEDIAIMHLVFQKANKIVLTSEKMYFYFQHPESSTGNSSPNLYYFLPIAFEERLSFVSLYYNNLSSIVLKQLIDSSIGSFIGLSKYKVDDNIKAWKKHVRKTICQHKKELFGKKFFTKKRKMQGFLIVYFPFIISKIVRLHFGIKK